MKRVMVVDDDTFCLSALNEMLSARYQLALLISPIVALDALPKLAPHLIITDYSMPQMKGDEFITQVRSNPATADVPILAISGGDVDSEAAQLCLSAGAKRYLMKPVRRQTLIDAIEECFGGA